MTRMMPVKVVHAALSATGRDPAVHDMFELALVAVDADGDEIARHHWVMPPAELDGADAAELMRTRYFERFDAWCRYVGRPGVGALALGVDGGDPRATHVLEVARTAARLLLGAQLVTLGLDHEVAHLVRLMRHTSQPIGWAGHYDVTVAAAGALSGYVRGWNVRGRREALPHRPAGIDADAARLPHDPLRIARAMGIELAGDPVDALVRAELARSMYGMVVGPLGADAGIGAGEAPPLLPGPADIPPAAPPAAGVPADVDDELARVARMAVFTGPFSTATRRMPLEPPSPPQIGEPAAGPAGGDVVPPADDHPSWPPAVTMPGTHLRVLPDPLRHPAARPPAVPPAVPPAGDGEPFAGPPGKDG